MSQRGQGIHGTKEEWKRIPENATLALCSTQFFKGVNDDGDEVKCGYKFLKFVVMGHRGSGMNMLESSDPRIKTM